MELHVKQEVFRVVDGLADGEDADSDLRAMSRCSRSPRSLTADLARRRQEPACAGSTMRDNRGIWLVGKARTDHLILRSHGHG